MPTLFVLVLSLHLITGTHLLVQPVAEAGEADLGHGRLGAGALAVGEGGHRLGELEEDLALDTPLPDALAAVRGAGAPVLHDETEKSI